MAGRYEISSARWAMIESIVPLLNAWDAQGAMTVRCLTVSSGYCARAPNGGIFQSALGLGRLFVTADDGLPLLRTGRLPGQLANYPEPMVVYVTTARVS